MFNSKLIKAFNWIFSILLLGSLFLFLTYQGESKDILIVLVMLIALVASTIAYVPDDAKNNSRDYHLSYLSGYIAHIVIIMVMFLMALWELSHSGGIGSWFFVLLLTIALTRPVIYLLIKAFYR